MRRLWQTIHLGAARVTEALLELIYPPHCAACSLPLTEGPRPIPGLCDGCLSEMRLLDSSVCGRCAHPLGPFTADLAGTQCPGCSTLRLAFRRTWAACSYTGPVPPLIRGYKYAFKTARRRPLAALLTRRLEIAFGRSSTASPLALPDDVAEQVDAPPAASETGGRLPDMVVPVPLHPRRRRERGFDQAELLAEVVARRLDLPLVRDNLVRVRHTEEQAGKSRAARIRDLDGAFAVRRPEALAGAVVLLIDDVMTTGSTANACARTLRAMDAPAGTPGASEVWVAVAARVP
jgi:ComF family protein